MRFAENVVYSLKTGSGLLRGKVPGQIVIQLTNRCNATCPQCGMRKTSKFERNTLHTDDVRRIIDAAAEKGVQAISFTGGEPFLMIDELTELINHAGRAGIKYIRTGTNGYFMRYSASDAGSFETRVASVAEKLAGTPLRNFWISIDSCDEQVHEKMRGFNGVIKGIEKALPVFHDHGIYPSVNLGVNRNLGGLVTSGIKRGDFSGSRDYLEAFHAGYLAGMEMFYRRVIDMGFTILNTCYPMSVSPESEGDMEAVYAATATDSIVSFSDAEKGVLFEILMKCVRKFRSEIRVFSPLSSLFTLYRHYNGSLPEKYPPFPCYGGIDFFFIDAENGDTFPCGFRGGENFGKYWEMDEKMIDRDQKCRLCDWECFRDPSELFAPPVTALSSPLTLLSRSFTDSSYLKHWFSDMRYYRACRYFDGRLAPDSHELSRFSSRSDRI